MNQHNDNVQHEQARKLAEVVMTALDNKKGIDITLLEVGKQTILADFFVICTGSSNTHVKALRDEVEFEIETQLGVKPTRIEGFSDNTWTLMDYNSVVVHIFTAEGREFYKLEKLWSESGLLIVGKETESE